MNGETATREGWVGEKGSFDVEAYLGSRRTLVEEALLAQVGRWRRDVPASLAEAMAYSLLAGGKRIRPVLALAAFEACGGGAPKLGLAMDFAVALECVHTYSLIHDDLPAMDDDDLRRGRPTCHILHGEATAILAGDALLTEAFVILAGGMEAERLRLLSLLAEGAGAGGMVGGQQLDMDVIGKGMESGDHPPLSQIEEIHRKKTGALLTAAAAGGAIAAGASPQDVAALRAYGASLGLAFQIADDILDEVGDSARMGKRGGSDKAKGKPTYPVLVGLDGARRLADDARDRAVAALAGMGPGAEPLRSLATFVVERRG